MDRLAVLRQDEYFPLDRATAHREALRALQGRFTAWGYDEPTLSATLRMPDIWAISFLDRALAQLTDRYLLSHDEPLHVLIRLFLLNKPELAASVETTFSAGELQLLLDVRLLVREGDVYVSPVAIFPVGQLHVVVDWPIDHGEAMSAPNKVDRPGPDSYALARFAAGAPKGRLLDLCSGSGVVSLYAASDFKEVVGVDLNPRCTNFARFNALFNGVENCKFLTGDGYSMVADQTFDVITANPPYVPSPGREILCAYGGATGEAVTADIVRGLPGHLAVGGIAQIQTIMVESGGRSFDEKLSEWLGSPNGFRALLLDGPDFDPLWFAVGTYSETHPEWYRILGDDAEVPSFYAWAENYLMEGITSIKGGFVCIERRGEEPFRVDHLPISATVAEWPVESPNYPPFPCGTAHRSMARQLLDDTRARRYTMVAALPVKSVELMVEHPLFQAGTTGRGIKLDPKVARALEHFVGGEVTAAAVAERLSADGGASAPDLESTLATLAAAGVLGSK